MRRITFRRRRSLLTLALIAVILAFALAYLVPLWWMIVVAFSTSTISIRLVDLIPQEINLANFELLLGRFPALRWMLNSAIVATIGTALIVALSATAGYAFGVKRFPGRDLLFWLVIGTMAMPPAVTLVPLFLTTRELGWVNSYAGLIVPSIASAFGVFLIKQFMQTIPRELLDAARVDGAGEARLFLQIVVPLAKPALAALAIFSFMSYWNDYLWPLVVASREEMRTLQVGVAAVAIGREATDYGLVLAGGVLAFAPMLVMFVAFQGYFVRGISTGSLKG